MLRNKKKSLINKAWRKRIKQPKPASKTPSPCSPLLQMHSPATSPTSALQNSHLPHANHRFAQNLVSHQSQNISTNTSLSDMIIGNESVLKSSVENVLNQLKVDQLKDLNHSLETACAGGSCVLVPKEDVCVGGAIRVSPVYLSLLVWRWPDLRSDVLLRPNPPCHRDTFYSCINPYHSSVCCLPQPDSPPPPYRELPPPPDRLRPPDDNDGAIMSSAPSSIHESRATSGQPHSSGWCSMWYWEHGVRVGEMFDVCKDSVSVLGDDAPPMGGADLALCLNLLSASSNTSTHNRGAEESRKTREKIGLGIMLSREGSEVFLYNQSGVDVFVSSPTLPGPEDEVTRIERPNVHKVPPGQYIRIFNFNFAQHLYSNYSRRRRHHGPVEVYAVTVSFRKGWGHNYKRQEVTECPCWLELHLKEPR